MMPKIAIAISGGIDSLVAAYLLKQQGHRVVGIHFLTGYESVSPTCRAESGPHRRDPGIARIAGQLGIDYQVVDLSSEFRQTVVAYFTRTYLNGRTPNPCMVCNPLIKFQTLFNAARKLGAARLATGHYARVIRSTGGHYRLFTGSDTLKDQSYFLARLKPSQLETALFPLGEMTKAEVRQLAADRKLKPASGEESQDVCFIKDGTYGAFMNRECGLSPEPGPIEDLSGNIIGRHQGLHLFTVGQRRGINCPAALPYYVVSIDVRHNRLVVGLKEDLLRRECRVADINWIHEPGVPMRIHVRLRYRHRAASATLVSTDSGEALVRFDKPQSAVTPGQGAVFYDGPEVLGGGWIV